MEEFWNFKDFLSVAGHYWPWLLLAGLLGLVLGLRACGGEGDGIPPQFRSTHDIEE